VENFEVLFLCTHLWNFFYTWRWFVNDSKWWGTILLTKKKMFFLQKR